MPVAKKDTTLTSVLEGKTLRLQRNTSEFSHNFYDRRKFIKDVIPVFSSNYNNRGKLDHKDHTMILVPGGSGIGKTRAGWELQHLVTHADYFKFKFAGSSAKIDLFREALQNPCYLYINLNYRHTYNQRFDEKYDAEVRIGARLAAASGLCDKYLDDMVDMYPVELFSIREVIQ